jgi:hypothetical protein
MLRRRSVLYASYASRRAAIPLAVGLPAVRVRVSEASVSRYLMRAANVIARVAG